MMREVRFCIRIRRKKLLYVKVSWKSFYSKFYDRDWNLESRRSETLLSGVDVYAKEDIVSADGLGTVYHKAGDKVATIVTNDKGIARIDDLPLAV